MIMDATDIKISQLEWRARNARASAAQAAFEARECEEQAAELRRQRVAQAVSRVKR